MCCCKEPNINGAPGAYSWDGKNFSTYPAMPPALADGDMLIYDEPGRCGGIDCHSHHFRLVRGRFGTALLVKHGGGEERIGLSCADVMVVRPLAALDSNARYWLLHALYSAHSQSRRAAIEETSNKWRRAAAQKRIKTRKLPSRGQVRVWIEPEQVCA